MAGLNFWSLSTPTSAGEVRVKFREVTADSIDEYGNLDQVGELAKAIGSIVKDAAWPPTSPIELCQNNDAASELGIFVLSDTLFTFYVYERKVEGCSPVWFLFDYIERTRLALLLDVVNAGDFGVHETTPQSVDAQERTRRALIDLAKRCLGDSYPWDLCAGSANDAAC